MKKEKFSKFFRPQLKPLRELRYQVELWDKQSIVFGEVRLFLYPGGSIKIKIVKKLGWEFIQKHLVGRLGGQSSQLTWQIDNLWRLFDRAERIQGYWL